MQFDAVGTEEAIRRLYDGPVRNTDRTPPFGWRISGGPIVPIPNTAALVQLGAIASLDPFVGQRIAPAELPEQQRKARRGNDCQHCRRRAMVGQTTWWAFAWSNRNGIVP